MCSSVRIRARLVLKSRKSVIANWSSLYHQKPSWITLRFKWRKLMEGGRAEMHRRPKNTRNPCTRCKTPFEGAHAQWAMPFVHTLTGLQGPHEGVQHQGCRVPPGCLFRTSSFAPFVPNSTVVPSNQTVCLFPSRVGAFARL